jgi:hypothetical protein
VLAHGDNRSEYAEFPAVRRSFGEVRRGVCLAHEPVYTDAFRGDLGWITFERDASGKIIRLNVSQDRMWRLPFDRR